MKDPRFHREPGADFSYEISDEQLVAYSKIPLLERLKRLDELRLSILGMNAAVSEIATDVKSKK